MADHTYSDYTPGPYGPGPEFGTGEIKFDHGSEWREEIIEVKKVFSFIKALLADLKDEWESDTDQKTGIQGSYNELKSDELETIENVIETVEDAMRQMESI